MTSEVLALVLRANLVLGAAILLILALRPVMTGRFGAQTTYLLWAMAPLAVLASLLPARRAVVEADSVLGVAVAERAEAAPFTVEALLPDPVRTIAPTFDPEPWLFGVWLAGAVVSLGVLAWRQARFRRSLGALTPDGRIYRAEAHGVGPAVVGVIFPRIVTPADFEHRFDAEERRLVLAHEETHFRRGDPLVNAVVAAVRCLAWFNPLVHVAAHYLRMDQELACDAAVIGRFPGSRRTYAEAMLKTQIAPLSAPLACYWPGRTARPMKQRIALLKAPIATRKRLLGGAAAVAGLSLCSGAIAWAAQPARIETRQTTSLTPIAYAPGVMGAGPVDPGRNRKLGAQLVEAIDEGYPDAIRGLVQAGADVNHFVPGDGTPLLRAARLGDMDTARLLIRSGANVNKPAPGDGSPLIAASAHGRRDMVEMLIRAGADVNGFVLGDETPLINAARSGELSVVAYLIEQGADPNLAVPSGNRPGEMRSPLSMAANPAIADFLRRHGARR